MKLLKATVPHNHNIFFFGDLHIGSDLHYEDGLDQLIDMVQSPYGGLNARANRAVNVGDNIEAIMMDDKRYDPTTCGNPFPMAQVYDCVEKLQPISKQLLCIMEGNHERKLWRFGNIGQDIANRLGVPFGTYTAKITLVDRNDKLLYKIFATHGRKGINSTADDPTRRLSNLHLTLKRHLKFKAGDCAVMAKGHTHKLLRLRPQDELYMVDDGEKIKQKYHTSLQNAPYIHPDHRYYINTGSFYRLYGEDGVSSYAEIAEYDPLELGWAVLRVRDGLIQKVDRVVR